MAVNIVPNNVGTRTQPCLTPLMTGNASEVSPLSSTRVSIPSWIWRTIEIDLSEQLHFFFHNPSQLTVQNALVKSSSVMQRSLFCSWHFSRSYGTANTISAAPRTFLEPHWLSGRCLEGGHLPGVKAGGLGGLLFDLLWVRHCGSRCNDKGGEMFYSDREPKGHEAVIELFGKVGKPTN